MNEWRLRLSTAAKMLGGVKITWRPAVNRGVLLANGVRRRAKSCLEWLWVLELDVDAARLPRI